MKSKILTCLVCNNYKAQQLHRHLKSAHGLTSEEYYLRYVLAGDVPKCKYCGKVDVEFKGCHGGYRAFCSKTCQASWSHNNIPGFKEDLLRKKDEFFKTEIGIGLARENGRKQMLSNWKNPLWTDNRRLIMFGADSPNNQFKRVLSMRSNKYGYAVPSIVNSVFGTFCVRSNTEKKFILFCDEHHDVIKSIDYESIYIPYEYDGKRWYIPDFVLELHNGNRIIIEIKTSDHIASEIDELKWDAATSYCDNQGMIFRVVRGGNYQEAIL